MARVRPWMVAALAGAVLVVGVGGYMSLSSSGHSGGSRLAAPSTTTPPPPSGPPSGALPQPTPASLPSDVKLPPPPSARIATVPSGIAADCSADVTDKLAAWIGSVPDNTTLEFKAGGCYRIEKSLQLTDRNGLTFDGQGATFKATTDGAGFVKSPKDRRFFSFVGGTNLRLHNFTIVGSNSKHRYDFHFAFQSGIWLWGTQRVLIDQVAMHEVHGDWVTVTNDTHRSWRWASDVTIQNCKFDWSGRQGIAISSGQRVDIHDNTMSDSSQSMIDVEADTKTQHAADGTPTFGGATDIYILNNRFGHSPLPFFTNYGHGATIARVTISGNSISGSPLVVWVKGTMAVHRGPYTITNNVSDTLYNSPRSSFELTYVDGAVITHNTTMFRTARPMDAVRIWGCTNIEVTGNTFTGAARVLVADAAGPRPWSGAASTGTKDQDNVT